MSCRLDLRPEGTVGHALVSGVEIRGKADGSSSDAWDTSSLPVGWQTLSDGGADAAILALDAAKTAVEGGRLASDTTWDDAKTHVVRHWVVVPDGVTLTVAQGALVKFCEDTGILVERGGRVSVEGATAHDVTFASIGNDVGGDTDMREGEYAFNAYRIVVNGGGTFVQNGHWATPDAVQCVADVCRSVDSSACRLDLREEGTVGHALVSGVEMRGKADGSSSDAWDTSSLPVGWQTLSDGGADATILALDAAKTAVEGGRLASDTTWDDAKTHVVRHWVVVPDGVTLTVAQGALVKFCEDTGILVERGGRVSVEGAENNDVVFAAIENDIGGDTDQREREYRLNSFSVVKETGGELVHNSHWSTPDMVLLGVQTVASNQSDNQRLDLQGLGETILAPQEPRSIFYSTQWDDASLSTGVEVDVMRPDGRTQTLVKCDGDATGAVDWRPDAGPGLYQLEHRVGDRTLSARMILFDETVVVADGEIRSDTTWSAGKVYVVFDSVAVSSGSLLTIAPGAVVKFMSGASVNVLSGGSLVANGAIFTHIDDDTIGGDTMLDGSDRAPPLDAYEVAGTVVDDETTEYRYSAPEVVSGTITGNVRWRGWKVYNIKDNIALANGARLTVDPGTIVKFAIGKGLVVNSGAALDAIGTRAQPIVFTSIRDDSVGGDTNQDGDGTLPQPGDWVRIGISGGRANFAHASILYSSRNSTTGAINMNGGTVVFDNGKIAHGLYDAVGVESGNFFMTNSVINDCLLAFRHWARDPIVNCVIYDCGRLTQGGGQHFVNCVFSRIVETWEAFGFPQNGTTYRNCCFWNEGGSILTGEGTQDAMKVCGKDGNIWGDPLFVDPENGDFRIVAGSPCVDAADSSVAPKLDFYGQPRITLTEQTNDVPVVQGQLADIGICEVMPRDVTSDIDLQPVSVRAEEKATPGQLIFVKWTVSNVGGVEVDGSWRDTISLVSENGQQVTLGDKITTSHIAVGGEVFCSAYFTVPAMAEGKWRLKVNVNSYHDIFEGSLFANNALTSDRTVEISLPSIDPAQGATDGVINAAIPKVLKLTFAEGEENRMVHLDIPAGVKVTYGFGFMPRGNSASGTAVAGDTGVRFRVPEDATDVYVALESDETTAYELSYSKDKIVIASVTPNTLPSSGQVTGTITGAGFTSESQVEFVRGGMSIAPVSIRYVDASTLAATVDCTKFVAGATYDVRVLNGEDVFSAEGVVTAAAFEGKGVLELSYDIPNSARAGRTFTFNVTCKNTGNSDMCCPLIAVEDAGNKQKGIAFSVDGVTFRDRGIQFVAKNSAGSFDGLKPGETVTFRVFARMPTSGLGKSAILVRANSEVDAMSDCRNEVECYLSCVDAGDTSDRIAKRHILLGSTNGEMVKNLSGVANRFLLCNGYALQEVQDLIGYGIACLDEPHDGNAGKTSGKKQLQNAVLLGSSNTKPTGVYVYKNGGWVSILSENFDFADKSVAIISHGLDDGFGQGTWLGELASALLGTHDFEDVLCVHWENEAAANWDKGKILGGATVGGFLSGNLAGVVAGGGVEVVAILREVSGRIPQVCRLAANQLEGRHLDATKSTFIGHSFGSHLLGYLAKHHIGVVKRHIGLDTAAAVALDPSIAIDGSCARQTEFYRSSMGSGQENPYATYNYAVLKFGGFDAFSQVVGGNAFTGYHSYAWQWFIDNVKYGKTYKIGYWSDFGGPDCLKTGSGYRGVILGSQQRFECVYPYAQSNPESVNYPGNKRSWYDLRRAWNDVADLHVNADEVSLKRNEVMYTGIPTKISVPVSDLCQSDVYSITRDKRPVKLRVTIGRADGTGRDEEVYSSLYRYDMTFNDCEIVVNDKIAETIGEDAVLKFSVDRYELDFMQDDMPAMLDLHPADNSCSIPVKLKKGDAPQANINGHESCGFVIPHVKRYRSAEEYQNAVKENKTFVFNWDGSGSRCRTERKIIRYAWSENEGDETVSEKAVFAREYYEFSQGCYPIALSVQDDLGKWSTVYGYLQNVVKIGEGEPIEEPQSCDPNEMVGPLGKGDPETERFVKPGEWMTYTVYFENKADATAAAQEVTVTNPLSEWLDWSTFEMGEVAFNNQIDLGLVGKKNGTSEVTMNGTNYAVRTELKLDEKTGVADWYLRIVDPTTETGWPEDVFAGFLPPNDETFRGEGHLTYRIKVREDAPKNARIDNSATIVFDYNPPIETDPAWWNTVGSATAEETTGQYVNLNLVDILGIEIPTNVNYAAGDKVTVKVEGLAKGLKLVTTPVYEDPNAKKKVIVDYAYTIEGVPTETVDFDTRPMYARVTVTYKDKTIGDKGKVELLQPVALSITTPEPSVLTAGVLNAVYGPVDIAALWPEVKDAKVNPTEWSFKGWPTGIKYNATAKDASWSYKDGKATVKTTAAPYTVYGQPTKAGEFPITATWKHKLEDNKTTVSETFSAVLTVWGDVEDEDESRYTDQAYVATATKALDATWKSFSGLPAGIKYTTKPVTTKNKDGSVTTNVVAYSLYGTPTKVGVFAVTATKVDPNDSKKTVKETFLWKVAPAVAPEFALDTGTAPVEDLKAQIVQGANQTFAIAASEGAKVTVTGLPTGLKLVQDKTTGFYSVEGVATKPGEYFVTFKTVLNGVTTVTTTAFTVKGNPFAATYCGYACARPAAGASKRLAVAEVSVAAAGTVKLTYTEGKTKYTASVKSFDWDDATGKGKAEGLVLKVSSADKKAGYGDRRATVTFEDCGAYLEAKLDVSDANGSSLLKGNGSLYATVKETGNVDLSPSQTFVFRTVDGTDTNALATVSVAYDAKKATAAFSGKLYDGTAVKATVPVLRRDEEGTSDDYVFAPFMVIAKDGTVYRFDSFSSEEDGGCIDWVSDDGEVVEESWSVPAEYTLGDKKFAELVPETGVFTFGWGSDAEVVGAPTESFTFEVTKDKNNKPAGVAIYDVDLQEGEKPLATVTAKVGKLTGAISVSFTSKKGDKAKYAVELVWRGTKLFAGHVTRTWKGVVDNKSANLTAYGTAEVK